MLKKPGLSQQLDHFLELSVAETTYVPKALNEKARFHLIDLL